MSSKLLKTFFLIVKPVLGSGLIKLAPKPNRNDFDHAHGYGREKSPFPTPLTRIIFYRK